MSDSDQHAVALPSSDHGERFLPAAYRGDIAEAEHLGRYLLASLFAAGRVALDAGCGMGYGSALLSHAGAVGVIGFDVDEGTVAEATTNFGDAARFQTGDVLAIDQPTDHFGLVTCFETIEHVADPERALDELCRVTAPDGVLITSTPNRGAYASENPFHLRELTFEELTVALEERFENVRVVPQQFHLATLIARDEDHEASTIETEIPGIVRKVEGTDPGSAPYSVAVASDGEPPDVPAVAVLTGPLSLKLWLDACAAWERRARTAEADLAAATTELGYLRKSRGDALAALERHGISIDGS